MICFPLDNTPYEAKDMGAYLATRTRGVFSADNNLAVTPGSGMSVSVSAGLAWLKWSEYWGTAVLQEQDMTLQIDVADGVLKRIDAIVCRLDKVNNVAEIVVKKGAYASNPIVSPPDRNSSYDEIYLATILVGAGITEISTSAITDQRMNQNYCGLMRDGVTGIPTVQMQEQVQAIIKDLENTIAGIEGGSGYVFSLEGKSGHLRLDDIGAQPQTAARGVIVKADASGNLVPAEAGKDFLKPNSTALFNAVYPVGSIYISVTNTKPSYFFGGTWAAFGTGRTLVGVDTTQNEFNTVQKTGGSKTHTLTLSQIPPHSHKTVEKMGYIFYGGERAAGPAEGNGYATDSNTLNTGSAGGGEAHNNLQPYITVYMWRRIA